MRDELIRDLMRMLKGNKKRVYAVPEDLLILLNGDGDAAIFLSQCLYWQLYALKDEHGWWSKPTHEFTRIGFGKSKVERVRQRLSRYLEWRVAGLPPVCHYRVRIEILMRDLFPQNEEINFPETGKLPRTQLKHESRGTQILLREKRYIQRRFRRRLCALQLRWNGHRLR